MGAEVDVAASTRVKVACINWGYPMAPKAMVYLLRDGEMAGESYWPTWAQAVVKAEEVAAILRRSRERQEGLR